MRKQTKEESTKAQQEPTNYVDNLQAPPGAEVVDSGDVETVLKLDPGDHITGIYKGYKEVKNGKFGGMDRLHKIIVEGEHCGMWGTQTLDGALDKIKSGEKIWIGYAGKKEIAGGNTMHDFRVARVK